MADGAMREKSLLEIVMDLPRGHRAWRQYAQIRDAMDAAHGALSVRYDANIGVETAEQVRQAMEILRGERVVWIPEAPGLFPPLYANESDTSGQGKIRDTATLQPATMNAWQAKHFPTREACQAWCDANPTPRFVPVQHGFEVP